MKAIVYHSYGSPEVLHLEEVEKPTPGDDEALVRVRAASANPLDYHMMKGAFMLRPLTGLRRPRVGRPGADLAGEVETVGAKVTRFKPGDLVFGAARRGTFAEYVSVKEKNLAPKPANITFEQAAAIPVAGLTALQGLSKGRIRSRQKVLINGAAGGVGTFAVQIAKSFGAEVTGVCSTRNVGLVRLIGAAHVIDYTREDFTRSTQRYDLLFDCIGNHPLSACRGVMSPNGTYVLVGVKPGLPGDGPLARLLKVLILSRLAKQNFVFFIASMNQSDLIRLKELVESEKVTPVIDRAYTLSDGAKAIRYLEEGHARGKVVITVERSEESEKARQ